MHKTRRSSPRPRHVRMGEPEERNMGHSGPPRRGYCSPRRTTSPRQRKATPKRACDYLRLVFMACSGSVLWSDL